METLPKNGISKMSFSRNQKVAVTSGLFDFTQKVYDWGARIRRVEIVTRSLDEAEYQEWLGFLLRVDGQVNTFLLTPSKGEQPRGDLHDEFGRWHGAPVVNGAGQTGKTLAVSGLPASSSRAFAAGDWFELSGVLHEVAQDVVSDASGNGTIALWRALGTAPANGASLIIDNPQGTFRLEGDIPKIEWNSGDGRYQSFKLSAREVLL